MHNVRPIQAIAIRFLRPDPANRTFIPDVIRAVQERYRFWSVPRSLEEYNDPNGADFRVGIYETLQIDTLKVYTNGVRVEAVARTEELDAFLDDLEEFLASKFDLRWEASSPVARSYLSALEFSSDIGLSTQLSRLEGLWERLTKMVASRGFEVPTYQLASLSSIPDPTATYPLQPTRFAFERRANTSFQSNLFFSEAPVTSDEHLELLEMFEAVWLED